MARQYSAELPSHTEQAPPALADDTTTDDAPKARKRKTKRTRKANHDQSGKDKDAAKFRSLEATETIVNLLESECSEEGIAAFDQAIAILVAASISERLSSEEQILWSVGGLAERRWPDPDTQPAEPRHPTSAVRYMVAVLAEEFGWLADERRVASISSWYSPRLVDFLREATFGPRVILEPKKQPWYNEPSSIWFLVVVAFFLIKVLAGD